MSSYLFAFLKLGTSFTFKNSIPKQSNARILAKNLLATLGRIFPRKFFEILAQWQLLKSRVEWIKGEKKTKKK